MFCVMADSCRGFCYGRYIMEEIKRAGVYKIVNLVNSKIYVGSSINLEKRYKEHFKNLRNNIHPNVHLQRAYNKHSVENLKFEIIEYVEDFNRILEREQYWMDVLHSYTRIVGYNISEYANRPNGMKGMRHTLESRKKMSESRKGKQTSLGRKLSKKTKQKIADSHKGKKLSDEHIKNKSLGCMKKVRNITTNVIFSSLKEAGQFYNVKPCNISLACRGIYTQSGGYTWEYVMTSIS